METTAGSNCVWTDDCHAILNSRKLTNFGTSESSGGSMTIAIHFRWLKYRRYRQTKVFLTETAVVRGTEAMTGMGRELHVISKTRKADSELSECGL